MMHTARNVRGNMVELVRMRPRSFPYVRSSRSHACYSKCIANTVRVRDTLCKTPATIYTMRLDSEAKDSAPKSTEELCHFCVHRNPCNPILSGKQNMKNHPLHHHIPHHPKSCTNRHRVNTMKTSNIPRNSKKAYLHSRPFLHNVYIPYVYNIRTVHNLYDRCMHPDKPTASVHMFPGPWTVHS